MKGGEIVKKLVSFSTMVLLIGCILIQPVLALSQIPIDVELSKPDSQTRYTYISFFTNNFDISSSGQAQIETAIRATSVDAVSISAALQQYDNGSWHTIKSWYETENGGTCVLDASWYVTSGYQYRLYSTGFAYQSNQIVESDSYTSSAIYY